MQGAEGPSLVPEPTKTTSDRAWKRTCESSGREQLPTNQGPSLPEEGSSQGSRSLHRPSHVGPAHMSRVLRPYIAPFYRLLNSPPGSNVSIMPRMWSTLLYCLASRAVVSREVSGLNLPLKSRISSYGESRSTAKQTYPQCPSPQDRHGSAFQIPCARSSS